MKIEIDVSDKNEHTETPWWLIIDPKQNLSTGSQGVYAIADMITGPFFSREEAQNHLESRRYAFGKNACVYCHSGYWAGQYKTACRKSLREATP